MGTDALERGEIEKIGIEKEIEKKKNAPYFLIYIFFNNNPCPEPDFNLRYVFRVDTGV